MKRRSILKALGLEEPEGPDPTRDETPSELTLTLAGPVRITRDDGRPDITGRGTIKLSEDDGRKLGRWLSVIGAISTGDGITDLESLENRVAVLERRVRRP